MIWNLLKGLDLSLLKAVILIYPEWICRAVELHGLWLLVCEATRALGKSFSTWTQLAFGVDIWGSVLLVLEEGCAVHCRVVSGSPGLCPLDARSTPSQSSPDMATRFLGGRTAPTENHHENGGASPSLEKMLLSVFMTVCAWGKVDLFLNKFITGCEGSRTAE